MFKYIFNIYKYLKNKKMLDNLINNDKTKFMTSYSKLATELENFTSLSKINNNNSNLNQNQIKRKENFLSKENINNFMLRERLINEKQVAKNILSGKKSNFTYDIYNEYDNNSNNKTRNILLEGFGFSKNDKIKNINLNIKNPITEIKPINYSNNNNNNYNNKNLYEKVKINLNEMRRQYNLEETFQKNNNLLENNLISPRNNMIYTNKKNPYQNNLDRKKKFSARKDKKYIKDIRNIFDNDKDYEKLFKYEDPFLLRNFNSSNKSNSCLKNKFNNYYESINSLSVNNFNFNNDNENDNDIDIENFNSFNTNSHTNNFYSSDR
jgi:hypothetical protein